MTFRRGNPLWLPLHAYTIKLERIRAGTRPAPTDQGRHKTCPYGSGQVQDLLLQIPCIFL